MYVPSLSAVIDNCSCQLCWQSSKKNQWRRLRRSWRNYEITLEKVFKNTLCTGEDPGSPRDSSMISLPDWLLGKVFLFSFLSFLFFFFFPFPLEVMYSNNNGSKRKKNSFWICFSILWNYILMGDNPYFHDLLDSQEIVKTFFCIKYVTYPKNRRQQTFSLILVLLKTITWQQSTGYN